MKIPAVLSIHLLIYLLLVLVMMRLEEGGGQIMVQDPAVTLVKCSKTFLAVFKIVGIRLNGKDVLDLPIIHLHEPSVRLSGQVVHLALVSTAHQSEEPDLEWNGAYKPRSTPRISKVHRLTPLILLFSALFAGLDAAQGRMHMHFPLLIFEIWLRFFTNTLVTIFQDFPRCHRARHFPITLSLVRTILTADLLLN